MRGVEFRLYGVFSDLDEAISLAQSIPAYYHSKGVAFQVPPRPNCGPHRDTLLEIDLNWLVFHHVLQYCLQGFLADNKQPPLMTLW